MDIKGIRDKPQVCRFLLVEWKLEHLFLTFGFLTDYEQDTPTSEMII